MLVQSLIERLRSLVGIKGWDYIILWKLSNGHRSIEWIDCCCAGSENPGHGGDDLISFPSSSSSSSSTSSCHPCRDIMFPHPRISSCDLLDQLPSAVLLDSGVHAETLLSNQISWLNYTQNSDSCLSKESGLGTRVLIPLSLSLGLLELFVAKQVPEDQQVIDFIRSQCSFFMEQQTMSNPGTTDSYSSDPNGHQKDHSLAYLQQQILPDPSKENLDLPHDISIDRVHLCASPLNPLQQFSNTLEGGNTNNNDVFLEGTAYESSIFTPSVENGLQDMEAAMRGNMMGNSSRWMEPLGAMEEQMNDESLICENNRSDDSDPNDDEDDAKYRRRTGKGPQSKNLVAERKRRKKLNDRLYSLRALVPKISKLDRASILGDAIDYVKELQKQVKDLQIELEEHSDDEETRRSSQGDAAAAEKCIPQSAAGNKNGAKRQLGNLVNGFHDQGSPDNPKNSSKLHHEHHSSSNERVQQMEPQVEVFQLDGNDFFVKVFCEHKSGGFVRLMEALNSLGLEVTNVNATRHTCLVSSIFKVERKNDDIVQADHVKESLLELTRNPSRMWMNVEDEKVSVGNNKRESDYQDSLICSRQMNSHILQRMQH